MWPWIPAFAGMTNMLYRFAACPREGLSKSVPPKGMARRVGANPSMVSAILLRPRRAPSGAPHTLKAYALKVARGR